MPTPMVREGSGGLPRGSGGVGKPPKRSVKAWEALTEVREGSGGLLEGPLWARKGSGVPLGGLRGAGGPSKGMGGVGSPPEVWVGSGGPPLRS